MRRHKVYPFNPPVLGTGPQGIQGDPGPSGPAGADGADGTPVNLSDLLDVSLTSLTDGEVLQYDGAYWVNADLEGAVMPSYAQMVDDVGGTVVYVGYAIPGTSLASASWRIKKITFTGDDVATQWADGNDNFDNVWNNRASLTYS